MPRQPRIAVISVGSRNTYGHPNPDVIARLESAGARVYRTDRDGAVIFETDGRVLDVTRWSDRRVERYCLDLESGCANDWSASDAGAERVLSR